MNNPLTRTHLSEALKGNTNGKGNAGNLYSEFGKKFREHYGITRLKNKKLYNKEQSWYYRHNNKCRWEV